MSELKCDIDIDIDNILTRKDIEFLISKKTELDLWLRATHYFSKNYSRNKKVSYVAESFFYCFPVTFINLFVWLENEQYGKLFTGKNNTQETMEIYDIDSYNGIKSFLSENSTFIVEIK